jgi:hypothetical protein
LEIAMPTRRLVTLALVAAVLAVFALASRPANAASGDSAGNAFVINRPTLPGHGTKVVLAAGASVPVYVGQNRGVWLWCDNAAHVYAQKASVSLLPDGGASSPGTADDLPIPSDQTQVYGGTPPGYDTLVFYSAAGGNCWFAPSP